MRVSVVATGIDQKNKISISTISTTKSEATIYSDGEIDIDETTVIHSHISPEKNSEENSRVKKESENLELNFVEEASDDEQIYKKNNLKDSISGLFNKFAKKVKISDQDYPMQNDVPERSDEIRDDELDQEIYEIPAFVRRNKNDWLL